MPDLVPKGKLSHLMATGLRTFEAASDRIIRLSGTDSCGLVGASAYPWTAAVVDSMSEPEFQDLLADKIGYINNLILRKRAKEQ